jgi:hypothetical protein
MVEETLSRVVLGVEPIIDTFFLDNALTNEDLPELGSPINKTSSILFLVII